MLLTIEGRIGEIALKEPQAQSKPTPKGGSIPSGKPPKHKRLGLPTQRKMQQSQQIAKHPEIVEKIKAQARES